MFFTSHSTNRALPALGGAAAPHGAHPRRAQAVPVGPAALRAPALASTTAATWSCCPVAWNTTPTSPTCSRCAAQPPGRAAVVAARAGRTAAAVTYAYDGLDGVRRTSVISFSEPPGRLARAARRLHVHACARRPTSTSTSRWASTRPSAAPRRAAARAAAARAGSTCAARRRHGARLHSSGRLFNDWLEKSRADLALLTTRARRPAPTPTPASPGSRPRSAATPSSPPGRCCGSSPSLAKGVLSYLAEHQAEEVSAFRDTPPGKIMHETRKGEMTALGELPFGRYYGGVDTTPLFVAAGLRLRRPHRRPRLHRTALAEPLMAGHRLDRALRRQRRRRPDRLRPSGLDSGLSNQGWKDSEDSVFHADGKFPDGPIAVVEVQGYAFAAFKGDGRPGPAARRPR